MKARDVFNMTDGSIITGDWKDNAQEEVILHNMHELMQHNTLGPLISTIYCGLPRILRTECVRDFYVEISI